MNIRVKGRTWWGKNPKNNWTARNKLHSSLKRMGIGDDMANELGKKTKQMGGKLMDRQTAEDWYIENQKGTVRPSDVKYILWDWQNERVGFIQLLQSLEWSAETIDGVRSCPMCGREHSDGHTTGCKLAEAIA